MDSKHVRVVIWVFLYHQQNGTWIRGLRVTTLKPSPSLSLSHSPKNRSESESESLLSHVLKNAKTAFLNFSNQ